MGKWLAALLLLLLLSLAAAPAGAVRFVDVGTTMNIPPAIGGAWGDYDNDGYPDLYVDGLWQSHRAVLYHNNGNGTFTEVTSAAGMDLAPATCVRAALQAAGVRVLQWVAPDARIVSAPLDTLRACAGDGTVSALRAEALLKLRALIEGGDAGGRSGLSRAAREPAPAQRRTSRTAWGACRWAKSTARSLQSVLSRRRLVSANALSAWHAVVALPIAASTSCLRRRRPTG
jgi:hypothetical protein